MLARLTTTTLVTGLLALVGLAPVAPAWAQQPATEGQPSPEAAAPASTVTTGSPPPTPSQPTAAPQSTTTTTTTTEAPGPPPVLEVERRHAQPSSHGAGNRRGAGKSHLKGPLASSSPGSKSSSRAPALAPGTLTPPLPGALAGPLAGVPSFFIDSFAIPPFLLPIYQAAGADYGIPWQVLAAINEVETDYGRDLSVSTAGAEGWMQFMPATWSQYGVDVNSDGFQDPYNPADAIFAAARYLKAAGGAHDIRAAVFAYNHSQAYVQSVILRARLLGGTPPSLLTAVTGLTEARFPVHAAAHFNDGFPAGPTGKQLVGTAIYSDPGAPVIAVQDGTVTGVGDSAALGRHVSLADAYGNTYVYAELGTVATLYPVLEAHKRFSLHPLRAGVHVIAGTVLGRLDYGAQPHLVFQLRPAGVGAPLIDPKPILDGWVKLQDSSAIHPQGAHPFDAAHAIPGQVLLESKGQLERSVERDRAIRLAPCERALIAGGRVDRRVLSDLAFLSSTGLAVTVSRASCAQAGATPVQGGASGVESIAVSAVDGSPVARGGASSSGAVLAVRRLLRLQGPMRPLSIAGPRGLPRAFGVLSRLSLGGDLRIGFDRPALGVVANAHAAGVFSPGLSPAQWVKLVARLGQIPDPQVSARPSSAAVPDAPSAGSTSNGGGG
jgi:hypothetical protein